MVSEGRVKIGNIVIGILLILIALMAFANPIGDIFALAFIFGFMALIHGCWMVYVNGGITWRIVFGVINIICGIFLLTNLVAAAGFMPFVFAIWIIATSISSLSKGYILKAFGDGYYYMSLIINIICLLIGIYILSNPIAGIFAISFLIGTSFLLEGIEYILLGFRR